MPNQNSIFTFSKKRRYFLFCLPEIWTSQIITRQRNGHRHGCSESNFMAAVNKFMQNNDSRPSVNTKAEMTLGSHALPNHNNRQNRHFCGSQVPTEPGCFCSSKGNIWRKLQCISKSKETLSMVFVFLLVHHELIIYLHLSRNCLSSDILHIPISNIILSKLSWMKTYKDFRVTLVRDFWPSL